MRASESRGFFAINICPLLRSRERMSAFTSPKLRAYLLTPASCPRLTLETLGDVRN
jgi:hypothetical protein